MTSDIVFEPIAGLPGWRAAHVATIGSTNEALKELIAKGRAGDGGVWLTAGAQTAGIGRRGRAWTSPPGNLYASLLLVEPAPAKHIGFLPLVCAVAVRDAVKAELQGAGGKVELKWPNDVLIEGAKCCGILLEAVAMPDGRRAMIVGCGVNIASHPLDTPYPATHLQEHRPGTAPVSMFHHLAQTFAAALNIWDRGSNTVAIRDRWLNYGRGIGQPLTVNLDGQSHHGVFEAIDDDGWLVLRTDDGAHKRFAAGDVFF